MMEIISPLQYASPEAGSPGLVCGFMVSEAKKAPSSRILQSTT